MRIPSSLVVASLLVLAGCASTPSGKISYYFPKAQTAITITQTLSCSEKGSVLHQVVTVSPNTVYTSDISKKHVIEPKSLGGYGADTDLTLGFTDDGRLTSVNSITTGQGVALVKDILAIAKIGLAAVAAPGDDYDAVKACQTIAEHGAKAKDAPPAITLTYSANFEYGLPDNPQNSGDKVSLGIRASSDAKFLSALTFQPDPGSATLYLALAEHIPRLVFVVQVDPDAPKIEAATWVGTAESSTTLKLNRVASVGLTVKGPIGDLQNGGTVWTSRVPVPLTNDDKLDFYFLPFPEAAIFGKQTFVLTLSPYGSITKLQYASTGSAETSAATASLAGFLDELHKKPTPAEQAADLQAEADLIYQQQRLAQCRATPSACVAK